MGADSFAHIRSNGNVSSGVLTSLNEKAAGTSQKQFFVSSLQPINATVSVAGGDSIRFKQNLREEKDRGNSNSPER